MKAILRAATVTGLLVISAALGGGLHAQAHVVLGLGGGVVIPMKSGFEAVENPKLNVKSLGFGGELIVGIVPKPDSKVTIRLDAAYDNVHYEKTVATATKSPKMSIRNLNVDVVLHPNEKGMVRPYVMAGGTLVSWDYRPNTPTGTGKVKGSFGFNGGAGLNIGTGEHVWFFVESRFIWTKAQAVAQGANAGTEKGTSFIPIMAGIRIRTMGGK